MVYSINRTYRGSEVNVIRGLFSVAFDFVVSADDSDDEDDSDDDGVEKMMKMKIYMDIMKYYSNSGI